MCMQNLVILSQTVLWIYDCLIILVFLPKKQKKILIVLLNILLANLYYANSSSFAHMNSAAMQQPKL